MLEEYIPEPGQGYTGQAIVRDVTYILDSPEYCKPGYVVLGIKTPCEAAKGEIPAEEIDKAIYHLEMRLIANADGILLDAGDEDKSVFTMAIAALKKLKIMEEHK